MWFLIQDTIVVNLILLYYPLNRSFEMCGQDLPIRHTLDPMHIERNFSANILKHLFGEKDTPAFRKDMEDVNRMEEQRENLEMYIQPHAPYVFSESKKQSFLQLIGSTQVPFGYSDTLRKHVGKGKLNALKSHAHHVLIEQIMPSAISYMLKPRPREGNYKNWSLLPTALQQGDRSENYSKVNGMRSRGSMSF